MSEKDMIRAIGPVAYETAKKFAETGAICPYDEETPVREQLETNGNCARCFVPQCPINK